MTAFESILLRWTNLEPIIQSEGSQKKKYKYCILTHTYGISRDGTECIYFQDSDGKSDIEDRATDMAGGEEGEEDVYGESNIEIYITICKTDSQWESAVWLREQTGALWQAEGWGGEGYGREVQEGGDMGVPMADSYWCMTENHKIL